jgi:hypothetical protein
MTFPEVSMAIERMIRIFAGAVVLVSLALAVSFSLDWLWLTAFVGANLFQSGFTRFCPLELMLKRTPWFKSPARAA